jgi:hypothetical protein
MPSPWLYTPIRFLPSRTRPLGLDRQRVIYSPPICLISAGWRSEAKKEVRKSGQNYANSAHKYDAVDAANRSNLYDQTNVHDYIVSGIWKGLDIIQTS